MDNKERLIGQVNINSGTLLITDGIFNNASINNNAKQHIELTDENTVLDVILSEQGSKRFLIIPLDGTPTTNNNVGSTVEVTSEQEED